MDDQSSFFARLVILPRSEQHRFSFVRPPLMLLAMIHLLSQINFAPIAFQRPLLISSLHLSPISRFCLFSHGDACGWFSATADPGG
jgi:hypothetical protein